MTDMKDPVDLDEYAKLLSDLETEVREYGKQRKSLDEVVKTLRALDASSAKSVKRAEASIGTGELVFTQLNDLDLPGQVTQLQTRYDEHRRSLSDVSDKMQQIVQEQQRASLESLQSTQHNRDSLERIAGNIEETADRHANQINDLSGRLETASADLSTRIRSITTDIQALATTLETIQHQISIVRVVGITTLITLLAFALAFFII